ncbi:MAG: hypothetical protein ABIV48_05020 [Pyrinomonadaceae bacterium]
MKFLVAIAIFSLFLSTSLTAQNKSIYTSTKIDDCRTIESNPDEGGSYEGECRGVGGFKIRLIEGDIRQTLDIISPDKKRFELNFWNFFGGFSAIGEKIEWRTRSGMPVALIARFNVAKTVDSSQNTSYLMIAKIGKASACVTDVLDPKARQNEIARKLADAASAKPCRTK